MIFSKLISRHLRSRNLKIGPSQKETIAFQPFIFRCKSESTSVFSKKSRENWISSSSWWFQPIWKICVSPRIGWNIKNIWVATNQSSFMSEKRIFEKCRILKGIKLLVTTNSEASVARDVIEIPHSNKGPWDPCDWKGFFSSGWGVSSWIILLKRCKVD